MWRSRGQQVHPQNNHPDKRGRLLNAPTEGTEQGRAVQQTPSAVSRVGRKGGIAKGGVDNQLTQLIFPAPPGAGGGYASRNGPLGGADTSCMQQISYPPPFPIPPLSSGPNVG